MGRTIATVTVERGTGMDVGCKRDALATVQGTLRRIGNGAQRDVYVNAKRTIVYKIERPGWEGANRAEYDAFMSGALSRRGLGQYGSPVALYTVTTETGETVEVLAMPFRAEHGRSASEAEMDRAWRRGMFDLPDMHDANYRVTANGRIKITDLGFGARDRW